MSPEPRKYTGHTVSITAVENGYLIHIGTFGASVSLVAKTETELLALLTTIEIKPPVYSLDGGRDAPSPMFNTGQPR